LFLGFLLRKKSKNLRLYILETKVIYSAVPL